ncbi:MAG: lipase family protein [Blastocatellia bacterium]
MKSKVTASKPFDRDFAINVLYKAVRSASLISSNPPGEPDLPDGYRLVGKIQASREEPLLAVTEREVAQQAPHQQAMADAVLAESRIMGLVALNADQHAAIVAFHGTGNIQEWLGNIDAIPVSFPHDNDAGLVHSGFLLIYEYFRKSIFTLLKGEGQSAQRVIVTGHSLGGALTELCCYDIARNAGLNYQPEMWSFAGPRAGGPVFAGHFDQAVSTCYRIVNHMDFVPQLPLPPLYKHVGKEVKVNGGFKWHDIGYAHKLETYKVGLEKLQEPSAVTDF